MPNKADVGRLWEQLLMFIEEGRVIPVVGRDLLTLSFRGRDILLYDLLAERLLAHLALPAASTESREPLTLNAVACRYLEAGGDLEDIYSAVKSIMPREDEISIPEPLLHLADMRSLKLFVTTTFDPCLEVAINRVRFGGERRTKVLAYSPQDPQDLESAMEEIDRPVVFHLLGKLSAVPDYAVTDEDILEFVHSLQSETRRPPLLFDAVMGNQLLILGCSFADWLARFFIRIAKRERLSVARGKTDMIVDETVFDDPGLVLFLEHFSARTKVFPLGAVDFVKELHQRWQARHPEPVPSPRAPERREALADMEPGAVFLSYASEDRPVVEALKEALEAAGIDVWFDKSQLEGGDAFEPKIRRNIERCSLFVPIISRHNLTLERRFFRLEWEIAQRVAVTAPPQLAFIVPVAIDDTALGEEALPDKFRALHWLRLPGGKTTPEFVEEMRGLFRRYQKAVVRAS